MCPFGRLLAETPSKLTLDILAEGLDISGVGHEAAVLVKLVVLVADGVGEAGEERGNAGEVRRLGGRKFALRVRRLEGNGHGGRDRWRGKEGRERKRGGKWGEVLG